MNVVFLSPAFPPNVGAFCTALARQGVRVLGVGDSPPHDLSPELAGALAEYVFVASLSDDEGVYRATAGLISRHGRIDAVESLIELWLETAARLRHAFRVEGMPPEVLHRQRQKSEMALLFDAAGLVHPPTKRVGSVEGVRRFAERYGLPLVFKPDTGAGAVRTFTVCDQVELDQALSGGLDDYVVQPFVDGDIVTYDGLADAEGRVVFAISHRYDRGIMQVVSGGLDGHYYSHRDIPEALDAAGRKAVAAFEVRSRFFHIEFFDTPEGYVALEMNLRPPGGFTTDMMNYACDSMSTISGPGSLRANRWVGFVTSAAIRWPMPVGETEIVMP